jgi:alcohol dehydrogenase class IV
VEAASLLTGKAAATADDGIKWVRELIEDLRIPRLRTYGMKAEDAVELVEQAAKASSMKANPIVLSREELAGILDEAL